MTNDGWHANLDMNKPLTPQLKQALIDLKQGKTEKPEVLKYAEKDKEILEKMKADALKYGTAPPWFNEVDPKKASLPAGTSFQRAAGSKEARTQTAAGARRHRERLGRLRRLWLILAQARGLMRSAKAKKKWPELRRKLCVMDWMQ